MKTRRLFSALLFAMAVSAFPQSRDDIRIYIPPVEADTEQADFFYENFAMEIAAAGYTVTEDVNESDYSVRLAVRPNMIEYDDGTEELAPPDEPQHILLINLIRNSDNTEIESLSFAFTEMEEIYNHSLSLLYQIMANVPLTKLTGEAERITETITVVEYRERENEEPAGWNTMPWYFGGSIFITPRLYQSSELTSYFTGIGAGLLAEYHFLGYLSAGTGLELATDGIAASPRFGDEYWNAILQIPLRFQAVFRPGSFMLQPYLGLAFNIPLLPYTTPALLSWQAGLQSGIKAGPGIAFIDIRFSMDFGKSGLDKTRPHDTRQYDRYMIYGGAGYKFGVKGKW